MQHKYEKTFCLPVIFVVTMLTSLSLNALQKVLTQVSRSAEWWYWVF